MSTPTTIPPAVLSCKDSPLSITGNVLGILTFAAAILVSVFVYINSVRSASRRFRDMAGGLQLRYREADHLRDKLEARLETVGYGRPTHVDHQRIEMALGRTLEPLNYAMIALQRLERHGLRRRGTMDFQGRLRFVIQEDTFQELLSKVEKAVQDLREVAHDVLAKDPDEPTPHEVSFRAEVFQELIELRNEMRNVQNGDARLRGEIRDLMQEIGRTRPRRTSF